MKPIILLPYSTEDNPAPSDQRVLVFNPKMFHSTQIAKRVVATGMEDYWEFDSYGYHVTPDSFKPVFWAHLPQWVAHE